MKNLIIPFLLIWELCEIIRYYMRMDKTKTQNGKQKQNIGNETKKPQTTSLELSRRLAGSNWAKALAQETNEQSQSPTAVDEKDLKPPKKTKPERVQSTKYDQKNGATSYAPKETKKMVRPMNRFVAMDCEMVGIGSNGVNDMLARVSIVNQNGDVLIDKFIKPKEQVIDYRTNVSGIRPKDIENGAVFERVQNDVVNILKDKILVGHGIHNDLAVLFIKHPSKNIRDTSKYRPLCKLVANGATPSLKRLTKMILGVDIQSGEHNSVEDARAAMQIYNRFSVDWEKYIKRHNQAHYHHHHHHKSNRGRGRS